MNYNMSCKVQTAKYGRVIFSQKAEMGYLKALLSKWYKACQSANTEEFYANIQKIYIKDIQPFLYFSAKDVSPEQFTHEIIFSIFQHTSENELKNLNQLAEKIGDLCFTQDEEFIFKVFFKFRLDDFSNLNLNSQLLGR